MREYKVGSTRGKALGLLGSKYKNDALAQAWVDRRDLAMLTVWFNSKGIQLNHMADVLRTCIVQMVEHGVSSGQIERIKYTKQAEDVLSMFFGNVNLNPGDRGHRNLAHNLRLDELNISRKISSDREENNFVHGTTPERTNADVSRDRLRWTKDVQPSAEDIAAAKEAMRRFRAEEEARKRLEERRTVPNDKIDERSIVNHAPVTRAPRDKKEYQSRMRIEYLKEHKQLGDMITKEPHLIPFLTDEEKKSIGYKDKCECPTEPDPAPVTNVTKSGDDKPRPKTDAEIEADFERIRKKDEQLAGEWDSPKPTA